MQTENWFDEVPVLGKMEPAAAAHKLREIGEAEAAAELTQAKHLEACSRAPFMAWPWSKPRAWQHTAHAFGYLAPASSTTNTALPIVHASTIAPDATLKNGRVTITLDHLGAADYPGSGMHRVLFDFYAQNQISGAPESLHFNATCRVQEGEHAAVIGYPLFVGLGVGTSGATFKCFTVNVKNDHDEAFLDFLESDTVKEGLKLATTAQPAIAPFSQMALSLTKALAKRNRNVPVQDFYMGLDFSEIATHARLAVGSYLAVQIPETTRREWNWDEWVYDRGSGRVVNKADNAKLIPYNYVVFSVSRYEGD